MNNYYIEYKIITPAILMIFNKNDQGYTTFEGIDFIHENFSIQKGFTGETWIAFGYIEACSFEKATNLFRQKLFDIVSRVALVSQCYIDFNIESYLVHKIDEDIAFLHLTKNREPVGLVFGEDQIKAVNLLLEQKQKISNNFFYYWNDAVNTNRYSAKLLLMFSALESLVKNETKKKDWFLVERILGENLKKELFEPGDKGLRHRLTHGEYFEKSDHVKNYVEEIHNKVISFFNSEIFKEILIQEEVVDPQRNLTGNKACLDHFIKRKDKDTPFKLKDMLVHIDGDLLSFSLESNYSEVMEPSNYNKLLKEY